MNDELMRDAQAADLQTRSFSFCGEMRFVFFVQRSAFSVQRSAFILHPSSFGFEAER
jgi:hypothetical protein